MQISPGFRAWVTRRVVMCEQKQGSQREKGDHGGRRGDELSGVMLSFRCLWNIQMETSSLETWSLEGLRRKSLMSQSICLRAKGLQRGNWIEAHERASWKGLKRELCKRKCRGVTGKNPGGGSRGMQSGLCKARRGTEDGLSAAGEN